MRLRRMGAGGLEPGFRAMDVLLATAGPASPHQAPGDVDKGDAGGVRATGRGQSTPIRRNTRGTHGRRTKADSQTPLSQRKTEKRAHNLLDRHNVHYSKGDHGWWIADRAIT